MAEEIIVKYKVDLSDFKKVETAVEDVTEKQKELRNEIKATYSGKEIDDAVRKLHEQGDTMEALILRYGDAGKALKAMQKELQTMAALGQSNTKEFRELTQATAQLSDTIGDTRGEIKKLASDTRVFDLMVQGARGVTAAFSVATGVTAIFGKESEDLQKTILKVQGAMAALQGVQELANIATEKGGIATKIATGYQAAYAAVVGTSTGAMKAFRLALAATGIGLAVVGIAMLVEHWETLNNKVKEFLGLEIKQRQTGEDGVQAVRAVESAFNKEIEIRKSKGEDVKEIELQRTNDLLQILNNLKQQYGEDAKFMEFFYEKRQDLQVKSNILERQLEEERLKAFGDLQKKQIAEMNETEKMLNDVLFDTTDRLQLFKNTYIKTGEEIDEPLVTDDTVNENKENTDKMASDYANMLEKAKADQMLFNETKAQLEQRLWESSLNLAQQTSQTISDFVSAAYQNQLSDLEESKQRELLIAGDNANQKAEVEKKYAIESAKIQRSAAIAERAAAIFNIVISLAKAIAEIQAQAAVLASNPVTAALAGNAYAQIGIAAAGAALQTASVLAKPLPEIPKFEKGGAVPLVGGRIDNGYLIGKSHREGGILINAQGGEYIWDRETTVKHGEIIKAAHEKRLDDLVFHKYVAPALKQESDRKQIEAYDDYMLRKTIKQGQFKEKQNAEFIVKGVTRGVSDAISISNRYR